MAHRHQPIFISAQVLIEVQTGDQGNTGFVRGISDLDIGWPDRFEVINAIGVGLTSHVNGHYIAGGQITQINKWPVPAIRRQSNVGCQNHITI